MYRNWRGLSFGLLFAVAGTALFFSPFGQKLEEEYGLAMLFKIRGPRSPPDAALIVNLDHGPSARPGLSETFSTWPRTVHGRMIDRLKECGAEVIVFDVHFIESRIPGDDRTFADSIRRAGNVVLFEEIKRQFDTPAAGVIGEGEIAVDSLVPPLPLFADAALGLAPFPIPKRPIRINQTWLFKPSAGEVPTLPVVALRAMARGHDAYLQGLVDRYVRDHGGIPPGMALQDAAAYNLVDSIRSARDLFGQNPGMAAWIHAAIAQDASVVPAPADRTLLQALVKVYAGKDSIHINYYGPPATLPTLSYNDILSADKTGIEHLRKRIKNKAVFIGAARTTWSSQKDGFYTVFSQPDGLDLSGVEIAATVYANLLEDTALEPVPPVISIALLAVCGLGACLLCFLLPTLPAALGLAALVICYIAASGYCFDRHSLWPPLVIPLSLQVPAAFLAAILCNYIRACRERGNIRRALGMYLPDNVVTELTSDLSFVETGDRMVYGACLLTDAQRYTALSESMAPNDLSRLMNEYYDHLFRPITEWGGQVCNVIGDSMLALWPSADPQLRPRENACQAALQVITAIDDFNRQHPDTPLPTRIGLHYGYLLIGNIGAGSHFEYAPIGDIVNTASRIEGLNKLLGTRVLASEEAIQGVVGITTRKLGMFLFEGKTRPIVIHEVLSTGVETDLDREELLPLFAEALTYFQAMKWEMAMDGFQQCLAGMGNDGPSRFYLQLCQTLRLNPPPPDWPGCVTVGK